MIFVDDVDDIDDDDDDDNDIIVIMRILTLKKSSGEQRRVKPYLLSLVSTRC